MKRKFLFLTGIAVMSLLVLAGCKKQDPTSLVLDTSKTATISGELFVELDYTNANIENVPSGTLMFFTVSNSEYLGNAQGVTIHETTVGSDGRYSITIPVTDEGVSIQIGIEDFDYNVIVGTDDTDYVIFPGGDLTTINAITNGNYIRDFTY